MEHLSYSQLKLYQDCPFKYYLQYVLKKPKPYFTAFAIGGHFHKGLENLSNKGSYDEAKKIFKDLCEKENFRQAELDQVSTLTWNMALYSEMYFPKYKPKIIGTEIEIYVNIPNVPIPVKGFIDVLYSNGFADYKTTSKKKDEAYDKQQVVLYSLWYLQNFKVMPTITEIHYFSKLRKGNFGSNSDDEVGVLSIEVTREDIDVLIMQFQQFWKDVQAGRFTPNLNAWKSNDQYYNEMINYVRQNI